MESGRMMRRVCDALVISFLVIASLGFLGGVESAQHVVGEDRGWELSSDVSSWSSTKLFKVGDDIWFAYSAAQEFISELSSKEEFESCNITNPIKMYTDGLTRVTLKKEGPRYFISGIPESCKNGLKLHVEVLPQFALDSQNLTVIDHNDGAIALAEGPNPSSSTRIHGISGMIWVVFALLYHVGL